MAKKILSFDAEEVKTTSRTSKYINVEIETDYPDEIINEFTPEEIINEYSDLDELWEALKEHYGSNS